MFQVTQRDGGRWSAADAFLRPALGRPNLEVVTGATVLGLELEGGRAAGVRYATGRGARAGRRATARGDPERRRDRLAADPDALRRSATADELRAAGVEARHELPGVGRNLQDHPFLTVLWEVSERGTLYGADKPKYLLEWLLRRTGPLTSTAAEVCAFVRIAPRPARPPTCSSTWVRLYFEDHGAEEFDGARDHDRSGARQPAVSRPGLAALGRPAGEAADPHQRALRARGPRLDGRRSRAGARDRFALTARGDRRSAS